MNRPTRLFAALAAAAVLVGGCGYDETPLPEAKAEESAAAAEPPTCTNDDTTLESYQPVGDFASDPAVERIRRDGLRVGVSAGACLMAAANPQRNNQLEGFDIEIAKRIGEEIFGPSFRVGRDIQFKVITAAERIPLLEDGEIDMVVRNMTITCDRWKQVAFSAEYYHATQKVLVREDIAYTGPEDLAGLNVCAPRATSSLANIVEIQPEAVPVPADNHTGCLVKFQNGEVDAITGDDTVLAGLAAQDPYAVVPKQDPLSTEEPGEEPYGEPYGVAINQDERDLVEFVNQVLEDMRQDGSWQRAYRKWLEPHLNVAAIQPQPAYGR